RRVAAQLRDLLQPPAAAVRAGLLLLVLVLIFVRLVALLLALAHADALGLGAPLQGVGRGGLVAHGPVGERALQRLRDGRLRLGPGARLGLCPRASSGVGLLFLGLVLLVARVGEGVVPGLLFRVRAAGVRV